MSTGKVIFALKGLTRLGTQVLSLCYKLLYVFNLYILNKTVFLGKQAEAGRPFLARQSGIALVTAILVVALASIAATAILSSANIAIHRAGNLQDSEKAWWYGDGVETWVKTILQRDQQNNKTDSFKDDWAKPVDYLPVDEGAIRGRVEDLQGRFNLNNFAVADPNRYLQYVALFERMLQNIPGADASLAKPIAASIRDWIDADMLPTGLDGAEDSDYLSKNPAYRTPNRPMESVSEVLAVKGMTAELYDKLTHCADSKSGPVSCITVLPQYPTQININTAPEPLMQALPKKRTPALDGFLRTRADKPADDAATAYKAAPDGFLTAADDLPPDLLTVKSNYFLLRAEIVIGSGRLALYSFYLRPDSGAPVVLGRSTDTE